MKIKITDGSWGTTLTLSITYGIICVRKVKI